MSSLFKKIIKGILGVLVFGILLIFGGAGNSPTSKAPDFSEMNLGAFPESDISALSPALWIDFSDASTVTTSSGLITQVTDKSGGGLTYSQATSTFRPSYESAVQNGLNVARFDGTDDFLGLTSNNLARNVGGLTIYVVRKFDTVTSATSRLLIQINTAVSNARVVLQGGAGGKMVTGGRRLDADSFATTASSTTIDTSFAISVASFDYTNSDLDIYLNKTLDGGTTSFQTNGNTSNTASTGTAIGSTGAMSYFDGDMGEIIMFHSEHTAEQRRLVLDYLNKKWNLFQNPPQVIIF